MKYQTFFSVEKGKKRQEQFATDSFLTSEDSWRFGINKLILGQKMFSTTFAYHYEKYNSRIDDGGNRHQLEISEILSVNDSRFVRLSFDFNKILQDRYGNTYNFAIKLNYFMATLLWNMNLDYWAGVR